MTIVRNRLRQRICPEILVLIALGGHVQAQGILECGSLDNAFGPFDYTDPAQRIENLELVESAHFNTDVEMLIRGQSGTILNDLDYTLRAFPNHHRALYSMAQFHLREQSERIPGARYSIHCWFDRAIRFAPADGIVRLVYGIYLHRRNDLTNALRYYREALEIAPNSAEAHYNLGLLYFDLQRYEEARTHAIRAYDLGYPLEGLRRKLETGGYRIEE